MLQKEGAGWRLAWDPSRSKYPFLVGGEGWAFELTDNEWKIFVELVLDLLKEHEQIKKQLMTDEKISLEIERHFCWGCLDGDKDQWSLQILWYSEKFDLRAMEFSWPSPIAMEVVHSMRILRDSCQF